MKHFILGLILRPATLPPVISCADTAARHRSAAPAFPANRFVRTSRRRIDQQFRREMVAAILIQQSPHAHRHIQSSKKSLIQTAPADHVNRMFSHPRRTHRKQTQRSSILQLFLLQKCSLVSLRRKAANRALRISKLRRPLRRRNNGSIALHKLQKVELTILRRRLRQLEIRTRIRLRLVQLQRHAARRLPTPQSLPLAAPRPHPAG